MADLTPTGAVMLVPNSVFDFAVRGEVGRNKMNRWRVWRVKAA